MNECISLVLADEWSVATPKACVHVESQRRLEWTIVPAETKTAGAHLVKDIITAYRDIAPALWLVTFANLVAYSQETLEFHCRYMVKEFERIRFH